MMAKARPGEGSVEQEAEYTECDRQVIFISRAWHRLSASSRFTILMAIENEIKHRRQRGTRDPFATNN